MPAIDLDTVGRWCSQHNVRFHRTEPTRIKIPDVGRNQLDFAFVLDAERSMLVLVVGMPAEVGVERPVLMQAANRINRSIRMGCVVVPEAGEVFYRATVPTRGFTAEVDGIDYFFKLALGTVDEVLARFQRVATGEIAPEALFRA